MQATETATRVMVFLSEEERIGHHGLCEALLQRARAEGMAGATVWRGLEGFGGSGHLRTARFPDAATGLPLVLEVVDAPDRVEAFLSVVHDLAPGVLVTREQVQMARLGAPPTPGLDDPVPDHARRTGHDR